MAESIYSLAKATDPEVSDQN